MTNKEYYKDQIKKAIEKCQLGYFFNKHVLGLNEDDSINKGVNGRDINVYDLFKLLNWLDEEHKEQKVDWSKVEMDTPVIYKNEGELRWKRGHFAVFSDCRVFVWIEGGTSFTKRNTTPCDYAKLAKDGE